jgi:hypothetical protein
MGMRTLELPTGAGRNQIDLALLLLALRLHCCWQNAFEPGILIAATETFLRTKSDIMPAMRNGIFWYFAKQFAKHTR